MIGTPSRVTSEAQLAARADSQRCGARDHRHRHRHRGVLRPSGGETHGRATGNVAGASGPRRCDAGEPRATPAPPPAPAPQREPAASITDSDEQQTEARALYQAGKHDEAASAAGRVLKKSPRTRRRRS